MKISFRLVLAFILLALAANTYASPAAPLLGQCDYYQARSNELGCGSDGYLLQFGAHFCQAFDDAENSFSPNGQAFLKQIKSCLQEKLEERDDLTCGNVLQIAADSHVPCYVENHFCQLDLMDKLMLAKTVAPAMEDSTLRHSVEKIEAECLREHMQCQ